MRTPLLLLGAALAALPAVFASAATPSEAVASGAAYIAALQQADGGFGGYGAGQTYDAIFALRSAGIDPNEVTAGGASPADFVAANAADAAGDTAAAAAKAALAAKALDLDPANVNGTDLIAATEGHYDAATGQYAGDAFSQGLAILGLVCTGNTVPAEAADALSAMRVADGGWGFQGTSDPDTTAIALQALIAAGGNQADIDAALDYLHAAQGNDGGWGFDPNASNTSSTAYVVQALIAAGESVTDGLWTKNGATPIDFLLSQQQPDGSFAGFDPALAAEQALPALAGRTFCDAPSTPITQAPPTPTATATVTATATATSTASATASATSTTTVTATQSATPAAPDTGTGTNGGDAFPLVPVAAAAVLLGLGTLLAASQYRER